MYRAVEKEDQNQHKVFFRSESYRHIQHTNPLKELQIYYKKMQPTSKLWSQSSTNMAIWIYQNILNHGINSASKYQ